MVISGVSVLSLATGGEVSVTSGDSLTDSGPVSATTTVAGEVTGGASGT